MSHIENLIKRYPALLQCRDDIDKACEGIIRTFEKNGALLVCGNGGSCGDAEHIAGELMKGFLLSRPVPETFSNSDALDGEGHLLQGALPALSLVGHGALSTAFANDIDANMVYAQQVYGLGKASDALLGISTSGNARNVCSALRVARAIGMKTIGMTGISGGQMRELCDLCLCVPADETYRVQELHLPAYHTLCAMLEASFFRE